VIASPWRTAQGRLVQGLLQRLSVGSTRLVLLVDNDASCARTLSRILKRQGAQVLVYRTRRQALAAVRRRQFDLAVIDLFAAGGGLELARDLAGLVPRIVLTLGMSLKQEEVLEAALGFPVHRKALVSALLSEGRLRGADGASSDRGFAAIPPGFPPPCLAATSPPRARPARVPGPARARR
jgi:CheY-like chemotaxis protein